MTTTPPGPDKNDDNGEVDDAEVVPLAVWPCAQAPAKQQRAGLYLPECRQHPGKMLPDLARRVVRAYSRPGDLVVDPMYGSGTTLVEAARLGRRAIGVDLEDRWVDLATRNLDHASTRPHGRAPTRGSHWCRCPRRREPTFHPADRRARGTRPPGAPPPARVTVLRDTDVDRGPRWSSLTLGTGAASD
jgi:hypothetical protein